VYGNKRKSREITKELHNASQAFESSNTSR
jgi:hypothetical protein